MKTMPAPLQIEHVPVESLVPWPENPRTISPAQMAALERSLRQFGLVDPLVVRRQDHTVIGSHHNAWKPPPTRSSAPYRGSVGITGTASIWSRPRKRCYIAGYAGWEKASRE